MDPTTAEALSPTKGEEALHLLYTKACADRDSLAETNTLYSKMLESVAEQNNLAERTAVAARKEAAEANEAAAAALEEKNAAVLKLQEVESELLGRVAAVEAKAGAEGAAAANFLSKTEGENSVQVQRLTSEIARLTQENTELRDSYLKAAGDVAFIPQLTTQKGNAVRAEYAGKLAALTTEISEMQHTAAKANEEHSKKLGAAHAKIATLESELTDLKVNLLEEQNAKIETQRQAMAKVAHMQHQLDAAKDAEAKAKEEADEACRMKDEVMANAQNVLNERERVFETTLQELHTAKTAAEKGLLKQIQDLSAEFEKNAAHKEKQCQQLHTELAAMKVTLEESQGQCRALATEVALSSRAKNLALRELRDKLLEQNEKTVEILDSRNHELAALEAVHAEALKKEHSYQACVVEARGEVDATAEAHHEAQELLAALQSTVASKDDTIVELSERIATLEQEVIEASRRAHTGDLQVKTNEGRGADQLAAVEGEHQELISKMTADFATQLHAAKAAEDAAKAHAQAEITRMQAIVDYNKLQIQAAAKANEAIAAANEKAAGFEAELAKARATEEATPGQKRRRK